MLVSDPRTGGTVIGVCSRVTTLPTVFWAHTDESGGSRFSEVSLVFLKK